jgi:hypothetical protein
LRISSPGKERWFRDNRFFPKERRQGAVGLLAITPVKDIVKEICESPQEVFDVFFCSFLLVKLTGGWVQGD